MISIFIAIAQKLSDGVSLPAVNLDAHSPQKIAVFAADAHKHTMANTPINWAAIGIAVTIVLALSGGLVNLIKAVFKFLNEFTEKLTGILGTLKNIESWVEKAELLLGTLNNNVNTLRVDHTELHAKFIDHDRRLEKVEDNLHAHLEKNRD